MEELAAKGLVDKASICPVVTAPLVLAAPAEKLFKAEVRRGFDLARVVKGKIVVVAPTAGAEGRATKEALEHLGWIEGLKPKLVTVPDGRSAARLVDEGGADAAILYACDLPYSMGLEKVAAFPPEMAPPVAFSAALCKGAPPSAARFLAFLREPLAQGYLKNAGFIPFAPAKP
jgi:molybdenum ABC transporter molybdate-binding protein